MNALPITTTLVDVVVTIGTAGSYTISLDNIDDAPSYSSIILVVGNKEYDLMKSAYTFTTTKAQTFMWKVKLVQGVITQIIQTHGNGIDVTSINRQVYITGLQSEATIQVYDMLAVSVRKSQIYRVLKRKRYAKDYLPKKNIEKNYKPNNLCGYLAYAYTIFAEVHNNQKNTIMPQMIQWKNELISINPTDAKKLEYSRDSGRVWMPRYHGNRYDFLFQDLMDNGTEILATTTMGLFSSVYDGSSWVRK